MQTIDELNYLVDTGTITKQAAEKILNAVTDSIRRVKDRVSDIANAGDLEKTASGKADLGSQLMTGLLSSIGLTLGGMGVNYIAKEWDKSKTQAAHQRSFQEMHRVRPQIRDIDPMKTQEFFSVLADTAPDLAKNPFIAANFVERQAQGYGGVGFEEAGALARANESLARGKGPSMMAQLGDSLTQQGMSSIGSNVSYVTRLGIDEALKKSPEEIGREQAEIESTKDLHMRESGMMDRLTNDKLQDMQMRDRFAIKAENRKNNAALDMLDEKYKQQQEMQDRKESFDSRKHDADMRLKQLEQDQRRERESNQYDLEQEAFKKRWGGQSVGNALSNPSAAASGGVPKGSLESELIQQGYDVLRRGPNRQGSPIDYTGVKI